MTGKNALPEKDLLEKAAAMKIFEYLLSGQELKKQTSVAEKQYKKLGNTFELDKITKKEKPPLKKYNRSNLIYGSKYSFYPYYNI